VGTKNQRPGRHREADWQDVDAFLAARELLRGAPSRAALGGVEVIDVSHVWAGSVLGSWVPRAELLEELGLK
jgi:hypothetical protein